MTSRKPEARDAGSAAARDAAADRPGLNRAAIVGAAVAIADEHGLAELSMRRVAERLGFTTMSLYRHVPGRAELVELMRDAVLGELPAGPGERAGQAEDAGQARGWRAELEVWARAHWELRLRHLWLVHATGSRRLPGPNALAEFDRAVRVVRGAGLPATEVVAVVSLVTGFVEAAARQFAEVVREERASGVAHLDWWREQTDLFARMMDYPAVRALWCDGGFDDFVDPFDFGLARTLDGVELLVRRRRTATGEAARDEIAAEAVDRVTHSVTQDSVTPLARCPACGTLIEVGPRGRPRAYCSAACRQRAYRRRRAAG